MALRCRYCGGQHDTPAELRECWQRNNAAAASPAAPARGKRAAPPVEPAIAPAVEPAIERKPAVPKPAAGRVNVPVDRGEPVQRDRIPEESFPMYRDEDFSPPDEEFDHGLDFQEFDGPAVAAAPGNGGPVLASRRQASTHRPARPQAARRGVQHAKDDGPAFASPEQLAGPDALGRNLVLGADQQFAPPPWAVAPRFRVDNAVIHDADSLETLVGALRRAAIERRRVVLELDEHLDLGAASETREPYLLGPMFSFVLDELAALVWGNSVDARITGHSVFSLVGSALRAGCSVAGDAVTGDVVQHDGSALWLDGGPVTAWDPIDGVAVVHRISLEHGAARPFTDGTSAGELAPDQRAAVTHPNGSARIIAPAGSGKTRVLTERARHLLDVWRLPAAAVSLVAFNKRAQLEMSERTGDLHGLQVRTLNAIALAIVNGTRPFAGQPKRFTTIDEPEVRRLIGDLVQFPKRRNTDPVAPWIEALTLCRLGLVAPLAVERRYGGDIDGFAAMFPKYRQACADRGVLDFDDQIYRAIEVLLSDPVARVAAQQASRMLLVDEFQDLTPAHVLLVRLLAGPQGSVFAVGDDDQTIYGYNGADPGWLIDFADLFPGAGDHPLEVNYRCPGGIVSAADRLLRHNHRRIAKTIRSASTLPDGWSSMLGEDTLTTTIDTIESAIAAGAKPNEIAVLTRVNSLLAPVQVALVGKGIPVVGGVGREFLNRTSISSALSWMRIAVGRGSMNRDDVAEALRRPSRPLHPRVADWVAEQGTSAELLRLADRLQTERDAQRVREFVSDLERLRSSAASGSTTADLLVELRDKVGLGGAVATLDAHRKGMNRASQNDDLTALIQVAALHPEPSTFPEWLATQLAGRGANAATGVTLSTVHRVKGQEWPHVIIHHAAADQFPHRLAEDLEEERRLFHVALTRASTWATVVAPLDATPFAAELVNEPPADLGEPARPGAALTRQPAGSDSRDRRGGAGAGPGLTSSRSDRPGKGIVFAGVGLVLVDQGKEWRIESIGDDGVVAHQGEATRQFAFGKSVTTAGARKGILTPSGELSDAQVRADDLLRQVRKTLAAGRPAYVVMDDATTDLVARALPRNEAELAAIHGIGPAKIDNYGSAILAAIEDALDAE